MIHTNFRNSILLVAPALLLCACGSSGDSRQGATVVQDNAPAQVAAPAPAPAAAADSTQAGAAGLREFIDPVTGQPREPTAAELKALEASKQTSAPSSAITSKPKPKEIVLPNGVVAVEMESTSEMKGCLQKDGRAVVDHDCKSNVPAPAKKP
jgi:hypothetical protein